MDTKEKEPNSIIVEDPMTKHLQSKSTDLSLEYFGLKKKDVSAEISKGLTHWLHSDSVPADMIVRLKKQIEMIKAMINAEFKTNRITIPIEEEEDNNIDNPT